MIGGFISSTGMVFQVHKTVKLQAINDISIAMLGFNIIGLSMILTYSITTNQPSIYIPLFLSISCNIFLIFYKYKPIYLSTIEEPKVLEEIETSHLVVTVK